MCDIIDNAQTKICKDCENTFPIGEFYKEGLRCKSCLVKKRAKYYQDNRVKLMAKRDAYYAKNVEKIKESERKVSKKCRRCEVVKLSAEFNKGRSICKECEVTFPKDPKERGRLAMKRFRESKTKEELKAKDLAWREPRREILRKQERDRRKLDGGKSRERKRLWKIKNSERCKEVDRKYREKNREKMRKYESAWRAKRRKEDPSYRLIETLRAGVRRTLKYKQKTSKTKELLGCTLEYFRKFIEDKFVPGMSWNNWGNKDGYWNLDHVKPISSFNFDKPESWGECFHHTNFQPLWYRENCFIKRRRTDYYKKHEEDNFDPLISQLDINLNDSPD